MSIRYSENDKMCDVICDEPALLQMMTRFGIPLGVGEKTVKEVCTENGVDTTTFLAVANYIKQGPDSVKFYIDKVSVKALISYLSQAHDFFLSFQLPSIRRKLLEAIDCSRENEVAYLILKFYDEYMSEVRKHMQHENRKIFTYVNSLMEGVKAPDFEIAQFAKGHDAIDRKLQELKNIIIKYYTRTDGHELLAGVLFDIFNCEADLRAHCAVEDALFVPAVQRLEKEVAENGRMSEDEIEEDKNSTGETLSDREKEIVGCVVKGMTNKEIAQTLFISVNTVLTHRKNISRKLNIHSISGLTIYAIVNKIVKLDEVHLK
jgi:regulator of cell morphogenesis and NO signaling